MVPVHAIGVLALALLTGACASSREPACPQDGRLAPAVPMVTDTLYFGTDRTKDGVARSVTPEEWRTFVERTVTPLFPQGLTFWSASGQWRKADGTIAREASYVLRITHLPTPRDAISIQEIIDAYKQDFDQKSVLRVRSHDCVAF
jgi:hypothetical protein